MEKNENRIVSTNDLSNVAAYVVNNVQIATLILMKYFPKITMIFHEIYEINSNVIHHIMFGTSNVNVHLEK